MQIPRLRAIALIFLTALILRAAFIVLYDNGKMLKNIIYSSDALGYDEIAINLAEGKGCVLDSIYARRMPLYPGFLAAIYIFFGHSMIIARFIQAIIAAFICVIIYLIASKIFSERTGMIAGLIAAVDYSLLQISAYLVSETVYIFIFLLAVLCIILYYYQKKRLYVWAAGGFIGLATLCRESAVFLIPIIAVWILFATKENFRAKLKISAIFLAACIIPVLPWTIRNYRLYNKIIPLTVSSGHTLHIGNNEKAIALNGGHDTPSIINAPVSNLFTPQADNFLKKEAINFMFSNPVITVKLAAYKFINMWQPYYSDSRKIGKIVMFFSYLPVVLLGVCGLIISIRRSKVAVLCLSIIIFYTLLHMFTVSGIRYRYCLMPLFMFYASFIIVKVADGRKKAI